MPHRTRRVFRLFLSAVAPSSPLSCAPTSSARRTAMFARALLALALAGAALASPFAVPRSTAGSCNAGPVQCCDSVQSAGAPAAAQRLGLLGIVLQDMNVPVGLTCDPIPVLGGASSANCASAPVCCDDVYQEGLVNVNCVPVNTEL